MPHPYTNDLQDLRHSLFHTIGLGQKARRIVGNPLQPLGSLPLDDLLLQLLRSLLNTNFELILRTLECHVAFLDPLQHLVEGSEKPSQFIVACGYCAQRIVFLGRHSLGQAGKLQDGFGD